MSKFTKSYDIPTDEDNIIIYKPTTNDIIYYDLPYKMMDNITDIDEIQLNFEDSFCNYDEIPILEYAKIEDKYYVFIIYSDNYEYNYCIISNRDIKITCNYSHRYYICNEFGDDCELKKITDNISTVDKYPYCVLNLHRNTDITDINLFQKRLQCIKEIFGLHTEQRLQLRVCGDIPPPPDASTFAIDCMILKNSE